MDSLESAAQIAKKLPAEALTRVVETACTTFEQILAPATALGSGIGQLVEETFDDLRKYRKLRATDLLRRTKEKLQGKTIKPLQSAATAIAVIEGASTATEPELQELWANLLSNELTKGGLHPGIPKVLTGLTPSDAQLLVKLPRPGPKITISSPLGKEGPLSKLFPKRVTYFPQPKPDTPSHWILTSYGLARQASDGIFYLTTFGRAFLAAVADPDAKDDDKTSTAETTVEFATLL